MATCGNIALGSSYDCDNPIQPGVSSRLILGNLDDIALVTYDLTDPSLITDIQLLEGKQAFVFEQFRQSLTAQYAFVPQTVSVGYDHQVLLNVFDISHAQKKNLEKMCLGKIFAVVENANVIGNADSVFEVYGLGVGMEVQTLTRIANDLETAGSFSVDLKTSDNEGKETVMPVSWWDTDYATTRALVDSLLLPEPPPTI